MAAVLSIDAYRTLGQSKKETLSDVVAELRAKLIAEELEGPDPWANVRDRSSGHRVVSG